MSEQFITVKDVVRLTTLSRATIDRKVRAGNFPKPIALTERRMVWRQTSVEAWMAAAVARAA